MISAPRVVVASPGWRNWQTRQLEVLVGASSCRFESCPGHSAILHVSDAACESTNNSPTYTLVENGFSAETISRWQMSLPQNLIHPHAFGQQRRIRRAWGQPGQTRLAPSPDVSSGSETPSLPLHPCDGRATARYAVQKTEPWKNVKKSVDENYPGWLTVPP